MKEKNKVILKSLGDNLLLYDESKLLNRRHRLSLKSIFDCKESSEDIYEFLGIEKKISRLLSFLERIDVQFELDEFISSTISEQVKEQQKFIDFSQKAKKIWNGQFELSEFQEFVTILKSKMVRSLYEKQLLSAYHLAFSQNACNFSVPGAGKTSVVYGAYSYLKNLPDSHEKKIDRILVIGPLSSFKPWIDEYKECFGVDASVQRLSGGESDKHTKESYLYSDYTAELTLISYQALSGLEKQLQFFLDNNKVMVVLDEAHKIKNTAGGRIANTALKLAEKCRSRVILTGTPAPNGYRDLYNLFKFIWPTKDIIKYSPIQLDDMSRNPKDRRIENLIDELKPFFIRIKRSDLNLPPKIEHPPIRVSMDESQQRIYELLETKVMKDLRKDNECSILEDFQRAKLIRLMQASSNPRLLLKPLEKQELDIEEYKEGVTMDGELLELLENYKNTIPPKFIEAHNIVRKLKEEGQRVVVWGVFVDTILQFSQYLSSKGIENKLLYGGIKNSSDCFEEMDTREKIIEEFNSSESKFDVIIANPFAVAESISIHKFCHNAIYLERNFDASKYLQSKDRIYRYGLDQDVLTNYYYLETENSIDTTIRERLDFKEKIMIRIMESNKIPLFSINETLETDDIKAVIKDYERRNVTL